METPSPFSFHLLPLSPHPLQRIIQRTQKSCLWLCDFQVATPCSSLQLKSLKELNCSHLMSFYDSYSTKVSEAKSQDREERGSVLNLDPWDCPLPTRTFSQCPRLHLPGVPSPLLQPCLPQAPTEAPSYILRPLSDASIQQAYLLKEGMLSQRGVKMIRDVMNEDAGYYKSLPESLRMDMIFTSNE